MPQAARKGDLTTGHGWWPDRVAVGHSPNVFINGIPSHRQGDDWEPHTCPDIPETHGTVLASGSPNVFVNGKQKGRVGDPGVCGGNVGSGSPNVIVN